MSFHASTKPYNLAYIIGIICTLGFFFLDWIVYPEVIWKFSILRIVTTIFLSVTWLLIIRSDDYLTKEKITILSTLGASIAISLMCLFSGEGFASPYYVGNLLVMVVVSVFFHFLPFHFAIMIIGIIFLHCFILYFGPWEFKYFLITLFFMISFGTSVIFIHNLIYKMTKEIRTLKGLLPICAKCKKIRDIKGYWNQIEEYIGAHSEAEFTHGLCPDCAKEYYGYVEKMKMLNDMME